jgi:dipeptidyl aminopeptidase/acylaminoacyl peptidase
VRETGLSGQVVVVRADGSAPRVLGSGFDPSLGDPNPWSPDGKRLAWGGCGGLCVFDFASSRRTRISLGSDAVGLAWSPDGRRLAAVDVNHRLVIAEAAGRTFRVLSTAAQFPAWSPNGKQVGFLSGTKLELMPAAGGRAHVVARNADSGPQWARDGRRLLYAEFIRRPFRSDVRVVNVVTHTNTRIADTDGGKARWSPDGSAIGYTRRPVPFGIGEDVWVAAASGGVHQLTDEFPTGLGYTDFDWASGSVPAVPPTTVTTVTLTSTAELKLDDLAYQIVRAGTPDSVVYETELTCDADAETVSERFNVWTPSVAGTVTTGTPCQDFDADSGAASSNLDAWVSQSDLNGNDTLAVARPGTTEAPVIASWTSGEEAADIGWRSSIGPLVGSGSLILFETWTSDNTRQLWRIVDGPVPHAVLIPLPPDATGLVDADGSRIVVRTDAGFAVLNADGTVLSRVTSPGTTRIGGDLVGVAAGTALRVYTADGGTLRYQLPLAHASGVPRLLTIGADYAVYSSGVELHLLQLGSGADHIVDLPGQAGPLQALLTTAGLFVAYYHGYDPQRPGRLMFVPAANLPND